jgi:hypothetical protein
MKNRKNPFLIASLLLLVVSCSKNADYRTEINFNEEPAPAIDNTQSGTMSLGNPYSVLLENVINNGDNTWTWIWSITNPNPGNGSDGTAQGLSNWGFTFGACVTASNLVSAGYSADGTNWTDFAPSIAIDPSQTCFTRPVLKFDSGTTDGQKTWYRLTVNKEFPVNNTATGYFKSGTRTGCGTFNFPGIGCPDIIIEIVE